MGICYKFNRKRPTFGSLSFVGLSGAISLFRTECSCSDSTLLRRRRDAPLLRLSPLSCFRCCDFRFHLPYLPPFWLLELFPVDVVPRLVCSDCVAYSPVFRYEELEFLLVEIVQVWVLLQRELLDVSRRPKVCAAMNDDFLSSLGLEVHGLGVDIRYSQLESVVHIQFPVGVWNQRVPFVYPEVNRNDEVQLSDVIVAHQFCQ